MAMATRFEVDDYTSVEVEKEEDGDFSIVIKQGGDLVFLTSTGTSPSETVIALLRAIAETEGQFQFPDLQRFSTIREADK
jgi:hypothetical protein